MDKTPVSLTSINKKHPRQKLILALLTERPLSKAELREAFDMTASNITTTLQIMIAKGSITRNPETGKYEIYPKKP